MMCKAVTGKNPLPQGNTVIMNKINYLKNIIMRGNKNGK